MARASSSRGVLFTDFGTSEHVFHSAVEQSNAVVGQSRDGIDHSRDECGMAAQRRQCSQVLGSEARTLAGEFAQPLGVHPFCAGRVEDDGTQSSNMLDKTRNSAVTRCARWLTRPRQLAH